MVKQNFHGHLDFTMRIMFFDSDMELVANNQVKLISTSVYAPPQIKNGQGSTG